MKYITRIAYEDIEIDIVGKEGRIYARWTAYDDFIIWNEVYPATSIILPYEQEELEKTYKLFLEEINEVSNH